MWKTKFCLNIFDNWELNIQEQLALFKKVGFDGKITWIDDLHLLPFDGVADWEGIVCRLNQCNYNDILTFELNTVSKPGRHENDAYGNMGYEQYLTEVYKRACRVAALKSKHSRRVDNQ